MVAPGINEDIVRGNRTYHLQTEERGANNPFVVSVLFLEGAVLATERTSYADLLDRPDGRREVKKLMVRQHRAVVLRVIEGEFDGMEVERRSLPVGEPLLEIVTEPSLAASEGRTPTPAAITPLPSEPIFAVPTPVPDAATTGVVIDRPPLPAVPEAAEAPEPAAATGFCAGVITNRPFDLLVVLQLQELERAGWRVQA